MGSFTDFSQLRKFKPAEPAPAVPPPPAPAPRRRGPPPAAPAGLRCAGPRGSRRGAYGGAAPRFLRPPAPRRFGVGVPPLRRR